MPSYLVETFLARGAAGEREARERRARSAAEAMTREGTRVGFEGSIHVPEDEICFFTFAAPSGREAALVAQRAGLEPLRVVEAIPSRGRSNESETGPGPARRSHRGGLLVGAVSATANSGGTTSCAARVPVGRRRSSSGAPRPGARSSRRHRAAPENFGNKFPGEAAVYMGIVHVAIYDAAVAIEGGYRPYAIRLTAPADTSSAAAIATAAHNTLTACSRSSA